MCAFYAKNISDYTTLGQACQLNQAHLPDKESCVATTPTVNGMERNPIVKGHGFNVV